MVDDLIEKNEGSTCCELVTEDIDLTNLSQHFQSMMDAQGGEQQDPAFMIQFQEALDQQQTSPDKGDPKTPNANKKHGYFDSMDDQSQKMDEEEDQEDENDVEK